MFGIDAVHGHNNVVGATIFPHNIGLGAARDPDLIRSIGEATAQEVAATGVDWTFGPTLAVPRDDRWGRTYEGYSEDPEIAAPPMPGPMVLGLQGAVSATAGVWRPATSRARPSTSWPTAAPLDGHGPGRRPGHRAGADRRPPVRAIRRRSTPAC